MEVTRIRALRGPNLWSRHTAIEAVITCDAAERDLHTTPEFEQRLRELFPKVGALHANKPSTPISMAHALELTTLALQAQAGCPVTFSRTHATLEAGTFQVVVEYTEEAVGKLAVEKAQALVQAALADADDELQRARAVWQGKFGARAETPDAAERARQMRFLMSRGFSGETIRRVLRGDFEDN